ncbi:hypothetical protein D088_970167 [Salmonella enterica subsp. houtenae serovar 16:z4,z32:-- str. RKS3027]|nr:hypothetical protein D088_970167 [Salmonella enterica subsp. houtenae serovar 16:z4,z32:-- str. RKS3027]
MVCLCLTEERCKLFELPMMMGKQRQRCFLVKVVYKRVGG